MYCHPRNCGTNRGGSTTATPTGDFFNGLLARNRGLQQYRVRGLVKVRAVVLLYALVQNLMRAVALRAALATG